MWDLFNEWRGMNNLSDAQEIHIPQLYQMKLKYLYRFKMKSLLDAVTMFWSQEATLITTDGETRT